MKKLLPFLILTFTFLFSASQVEVFGQLGHYWTGAKSSDWQDKDNWIIADPADLALVVIPAPNAPTASDNVYFDATYFDPTATLNPTPHIVSINGTAVCASMDWTKAGSTPTPVFTGTGSLTIHGSLTLIAGMDLSFSGPVTFATIGTASVQSAGKTFLGNVTFNGGEWNLSNTLTTSGNLTLLAGSLNANGHNITLAGNWQSTAATFTAGNNTVTFNGSTPSTLSTNSAFTNITISKIGSSVNLSSPINVSKDLTVAIGTLHDQGNQITGNNSGTLKVENGATLIVGSATAATSFPTNFASNKLTLAAGSTVIYNSDLPQVVKGLSGTGTGAYSNVEIAGASTKTLEAATVVRGNLSIATNNTLSDAGFLLSGPGSSSGTMSLIGNASLVLTHAIALGTAPNSAMPLFQNYNLDATSRVTYGVGSIGVRSLTTANGTGYGHLTISGSGTKTLLGNIVIQGNVDIQAGTLQANNFNIDIQGNWVNNGTFTAGTGRVTFYGTSNSEISGATSFYNLIINKASKTNTVTLKAIVTIASNGKMTFTKGIVNTFTAYPVDSRGDAIITTSPTSANLGNILIFSDNATVEGASHESHVNGYVRKIGDESFTFPIGDGIYYRPSGVATKENGFFTYDARYINRGIPGTPSYDSKYSPTRISSSVANRLTSVSKYEYWHILAVVPNSSTRVVISWEMPVSGGGDLQYLGNNDKNLTVAVWDGKETTGEWTNNGVEATPAPIINPATTKGSMQAGASTNSNKQYWTIGGSEYVTLPVALISFKAKVVNGQVALDWQSAKENNVSHYTVERSGADMAFEAVKNVKAKGESLAISSYNTTDAQPLSGTSYYRLRMVDNDGTFAYSKVVSLQMSSTASQKITLYPNPSDGSSLHFQLGAVDAPLSVRLFDIIGNPVSYTLTDNNSGLITIAFNEVLPTGMYVAVVTNTVTRQTTFLKYTVK